MKKVSIIVPVYNMDQSLEKAVSSLLAQNYEALEVILVDDGSTDSSLKLCHEIAGKDEKVYNWSDLTKAKVISVYMRILKDIDMLDPKSLRLKSVSADPHFFSYFIKIKEAWFLDACLLNAQMKKQIINSAL